MKDSVIRIVIEGNENGYYQATVSYPFRKKGFRCISSCGGAKSQSVLNYLSQYMGNADLLDRSVAVAKHEREKEEAANA